MPTDASESGPGPSQWFRRTGTGASKLSSAEDVASRISAYVYGNILVMAALIALHPEDLTGTRGVAYVVGTALSTYVAHVIAESVGLSVRTGAPPGLTTILHELRVARPIASSATIPTLLMIGAYLGWLDATTGLRLAVAVTVLRVAGLGLAVARFRREPASLGMLVSGIVLAAVCLGAALLKWWLTH